MATSRKCSGSRSRRVNIVWREASGSYGRLGCDDAAADAAIISQAVGKPVRVQWMRYDEHGWEPVSPAMAMSVEGALDDQGHILGLDYTQWSASHATGERGNYVAWHLIGSAPGWKRQSGGPSDICYAIDDRRARSLFVEPKFRAIYLRAPGGIQSIFAIESFMDELALAAKTDPIEFRLRHLTIDRGRDALTTAARLADWKARPAKRGIARAAKVLSGRGVAMARYGFNDTFIAMVAEIEVERATGRVRVTRVSLAHDCGIVINPDGVTNQIQGGIIQGISRSLHEKLAYNRERITSLDWYSYPILRFSEVPEIKIELINRPELPPSSVGEISTVPTAAAIANAIFDATGKRLRQAPFTAERVKALIQT